MGILNTRKKLKLHSWYDDEEVNVYLAGILARSLVQEAPTFKYPGELHQEMSSTDKVQNYYRLKKNADSILIMLGIFRSLPPKGSAHRKTHFIDQGTAEYAEAASYKHQIDRNATTMVGVLCKLSDGFEDYLTIFDHMRKEYLSMTHKISEGTLYHLTKGPQTL